MWLSKRRYDEIDQYVYQLLMDFEPVDFPFDVVSLAEWMEIKIRSFSSLPEEKRSRLLGNDKTSTGLHVCDKRKPAPEFSIYYNDDTEKGRWLFTISHEIGHIVLKHGSNPTLEQESEADYFAKQLMAPRCLLVARRMTNPMEIHDAFNLSWEASSYLSSSVSKVLLKNEKAVHENDEEFLSWCREKGWLEDHN